VSKPYYVLFTGGKNNAGDYLIKKRAVALLSEYRPDRDIIDFDGYRSLSDKDLDVVNGAKAVLLTGGPALHRNMVPNVYRLREDLNEIKPPITCFGIGWHSAQGGWSDTHNYPLSAKTLELLGRIKSDGLPMSVRDYHTQNVLFINGHQNVVMTGCPALYASENELSNTINTSIDKVAFSLGVALKNSPKMFEQMQETLLRLIDLYSKTKVEVVFHHGLPKNGKTINGVSLRLDQAQIKFKNWMDSNGINYIDISGNAENLIEYYRGVDLHVGYRVHAHIYMSSVKKPSLLISEDGRGLALDRVLGGMALPSFIRMSENKLIQRLHRIGLPIDPYVPVDSLSNDVVSMVNYELTQGVKIKQAFNNIDLHKEKMLSFIKSLP
jgi:hypothetical protein